MKIKSSTPIVDFDGKEIKNEKKEPFTFKQAILQIVNLIDPNKPITAEKKNQLFQLGVKVTMAKDEIDLTVEQAALVKEQSGEFHSVIVYGRICEILDGK